MKAALTRETGRIFPKRETPDNIIATSEGKKAPRKGEQGRKFFTSAQSHQVAKLPDNPRDSQGLRDPTTMGYNSRGFRGKRHME